MLDKALRTPDQITLREASILSLIKRGITIGDSDLHKDFVNEGLEKGSDYVKEYKLVRDHFKIVEKPINITGDKASGFSPTPKIILENFKSFQNQVLERPGLDDVLIGDTFQEKLDLNTFLGLQDMAVDEEDPIPLLGEGKTSQSFKTYWNSMEVGLRESAGKKQKTLFLRITQGLSDQTRGRSKKALHYPLTLDEYSNLMSKIMKGVQDTKFGKGGLKISGTKKQVKAAIYINSQLPIRATHLLNILASKPEGVSIAPYLNDDFTQIVFPGSQGKKKQGTIRLTTSQQNMFKDLAFHQGKRRKGKVFGNLTGEDVTKVMKKVASPLTDVGSEYHQILGRKADDHSVLRKIGASVIAYNTDVIDRNDSVVSKEIVADILLEHADSGGSSTTSRHYITNLSRVTPFEITEQFENNLGVHLEVDNKGQIAGKLNIEFKPPEVTPSEAITSRTPLIDSSAKQVTIPDADQFGTPQEGTPQRLDLGDAGSGDASGKVAIASKLNQEDTLLNALKQLAPELDLENNINHKEQAMLLVNNLRGSGTNIKDSKGLSNWLDKNGFLNEKGLMETSTKYPDMSSILEEARSKADLSAKRIREGVHKGSVDPSKGKRAQQLYKLMGKLPKSSIIGGPIGLGIELAIDPTSVAKADLPLPEDSTATQFAGQNIDRDLFQQEIENLSQTDEDLYLTQLEDVASQRPLTKRESYDDPTPDEIGLLEGIQARYPEPFQQQRREELRIDPFTSEGELKPKEFRGYTTNEHEYTELDPSSLGDERRESIKAIEAADLKSRELDDQMSTLMGEI